MKRGSIVQIRPEVKLIGGCFATVLEVFDWGVQGYIQGTGEGAGPAFIRLKQEDYVEITDKAHWIYEYIINVDENSLV